VVRLEASADTPIVQGSRQAVFLRAAALAGCGGTPMSPPLTEPLPIPSGPTSGFTHFQLDDFSSNVGLTSPQAVSPELFLSPEARQTFEAIWRGAFYPHELVEPFATNPRDVSFPMRRTWRLRSGALAGEIEFTRADAFASTFSYTMRDGAGTTIETGTVELESLAKPTSTLDFIPTGGPARRRGAYAIQDDAMQLDYGAPGARRPAGLGNASVYSTAR
jgi:hypothetical protein